MQIYRTGVIATPKILLVEMKMKEWALIKKKDGQPADDPKWILKSEFHKYSRFWYIDSTRMAEKKPTD